MSKLLCIDDTIDGLIEKLEGYEEGEALKFVWKFFKQQSEAMPELRKDSARLDWLADADNHVGGVILPRSIVEQNLDSMREAIDAAMDYVLDMEEVNDG